MDLSYGIYRLVVIAKGKKQWKKRKTEEKVILMKNRKHNSALIVWLNPYKIIWQKHCSALISLIVTPIVNVIIDISPSTGTSLLTTVQLSSRLQSIILVNFRQFKYEPTLLPKNSSPLTSTHLLTQVQPRDVQEQGFWVRFLLSSQLIGRIWWTISLNPK
jgi:hypothetical protein